MKSLPTQARAIRKRVALIKAAADEFSSAGFEVATAKSIARRADVATGTFYQYFENKDDVLRVIAENRYAELDEQVTILETLESEKRRSDTPDAQALFKQVLTFLYQFHQQDGRLHQVLDHRRTLDPQLNDIIEKGEQLMRLHVREFVEQFELALPEVVADSLFAMGEGLVHRMVFSPCKQAPEQMLQVGAEILAGYFKRHSPTKPL